MREVHLRYFHALFACFSHGFWTYPSIRASGGYLSSFEVARGTEAPLAELARLLHRY